MALSLAEKLAAKKAEAAALAASKEASPKDSEDRREQPPAAPAVILEAMLPEETVKAGVVDSKVIPIVAISDAIKEAPTAVLTRRESDLKTADDLLARIRELQDIAEEDLSHAMKDLQTALIHNPSAVAVMLPEDIGAMTAALRRLTGTAITQATAKKEKKGTKPRTMTKEEMEAAFDEL